MDRYFVLDSKCIFYGKNKRTLSVAFSRIDLTSVSVIDADESVYGSSCFQLITPHKVYILKGNNRQNKTKWMQAIKKQSLISNENRRFDQFDEEIKKNEISRAMRDKDTILLSFSYDSLVQIAEGASIISEFLPNRSMQGLIESHWEYTENAEGKPLFALEFAVCKYYLECVQYMWELISDIPSFEE